MNPNARLLLTGTNSGCGKTTVTIALLAALKARGIPLAAFKCGPDYIDPMFHREAIGISSHNLDPFFSQPEGLRKQMAGAAGSLSVVEGVMGYYDGIGRDGQASTWHVAAATQTPAVLVINAKGMYTSAGAVLQGFTRFRENSGIKGVIFNGISKMLLKDLSAIAEDAGVKAYGVLPRAEHLAVESRHLGLVTAAEIDDLQDRLKALGELAEANLDLDGLLALADTAPALPAAEAAAPVASGVKIAVARDNAFCFIYEENLELLRALGCELVFFSPLKDEAVPEGVAGMYLPGGYPELYTKELSQNESMLNSVRENIAKGLPTVAECGGFLYLHKTLDGVPMAGVIDAEAAKSPRLQRFGYTVLKAQEDTVLCGAGETIPAHEFHYYDSSDYGKSCVSEKPSGKRWDCIHATQSLWTGFPHLYFPANPAFAEAFVRKAASYAVL